MKEAQDKAFGVSNVGAVSKIDCGLKIQDWCIGDGVEAPPRLGESRWCERKVPLGTLIHISAYATVLL